MFPDDESTGSVFDSDPFGMGSNPPEEKQQSRAVDARQGIARARAIQAEAQKLKKREKEIKAIRRLRLLRCCSCGGCLTVVLPIIVIIAAIVVIFFSFDADVTGFFREMFPTYDKVISGVTDFFCWLDPNCQ